MVFQVSSVPASENRLYIGQFVMCGQLSGLESAAALFVGCGGRSLGDLNGDMKPLGVSGYAMFREFAISPVGGVNARAKSGERLRNDSGYFAGMTHNVAFSRVSASRSESHSGSRGLDSL